MERVEKRGPKARGRTLLLLGLGALACGPGELQPAVPGSEREIFVHHVHVEFTGPTGGPNEFVVRDAGSRTVARSAVHPTGLREPVAWALDDPADVVVFSRGNELLNLPAASNQGAQNWVMGLLPEAGRPLGILRGDVPTRQGNRVHYTAVELTGANWTVATARGTPPAGSTGIFPLSGDIGSWRHAFLYTQRRNSTNNMVATLGVVVWPGTDTASVRVRADADSHEEAEDRFLAIAISNPHIAVEHRDTITGGERPHPPVANDEAQTVHVPTANVGPGGPAGVAVFSIHAMDGVHNQAPMFHWQTRLQADGGGGHRVEWYRPRSKGRCPPDEAAGTTDWHQQVVRFAPDPPA